MRWGLFSSNIFEEIITFFLVLLSAAGVFRALWAAMSRAAFYGNQTV